MESRPEPPLQVENTEQLIQCVSENPLEWYHYIRNVQAYIAIGESEHATLRTELSRSQVQVQDLSRELSAQQAIIQYQKKSYREELEEITSKWIRAEAEKEKALAIGIPAVYTPASPPVSARVAEATIDPPKGTTSPAAATPSEFSRISERLPDPKEFDGTRTDLRRFVQQIHAKMTTNQDRFPTTQSRLTYVAGRLIGRAYELVLPKIRYGIPQFVDYTELLLDLESAFGDPDRIQNAQNKLYRLRQNNLDFSVFYAEFQRLALEGEMPNSGLTPLLTQAISRELQDMLLHNPAPSREYQTYARHLQELDNRYRQHQQQTVRPRHSTPSTGSYSAINGTTRASEKLTTTRVAVTTPVSGTRPAAVTVSATEPMDLSRQQPYTRYLGPSRKETGACFRCGSKEHRVRDCLHPDTRPEKLRSATRSPPASPRGSPARGRSPPSPRPSSPQSGISVKGVSLGSVATRL